MSDGMEEIIEDFITEAEESLEKIEAWALRQSSFHPHREKYRESGLGHRWRQTEHHHPSMVLSGQTFSIWHFNRSSAPTAPRLRLNSNAMVDTALR